eukprot:COSAG04_NODE_648_length_11585_cov_20.935335_11_plen_208_part_00
MTELGASDHRVRHTRVGRGSCGGCLRVRSSCRRAPPAAATLHPCCCGSGPTTDAPQPPPHSSTSAHQSCAAHQSPHVSQENANVSQQCQTSRMFNCQPSPIESRISMLSRIRQFKISSCRKGRVTWLMPSDHWHAWPPRTYLSTKNRSAATTLSSAVSDRYAAGPRSFGATLWNPGVKTENTAKKWRKNEQKWARYGLRKRVRAAVL